MCESARSARFKYKGMSRGPDAFEQKQMALCVKKILLQLVSAGADRTMWWEHMD
jgi:hypothetical protein